MRFDDRNRYGQNGVPANILFSGGQRVVVWMKDETISKAGKRNRFAKVIVAESGTEAELVELLGPVGEYKAELEAYQLVFGLRPCKYPKPPDWGLLPPDAIERQDYTHLHVFSVDNPGTRDIDDALSLELIGTPAADGTRACVLGIHVADVAARMPPASPLFAWAAHRCASVRCAA